MPTVAVLGDTMEEVKSEQAIFTVPETAGIDLGDVPPALVASMVYV